eukprot:g10251.t1
MELRQEEEQYLFQVFKDDGYPKNWVRRCLQEQHQKDSTCPDALITLPYIRITTRLLRPLGIRVAQSPHQPYDKCSPELKTHSPPWT